ADRMPRVTVRDRSLHGGVAAPSHPDRGRADRQGARVDVAKAHEATFERRGLLRPARLDRLEILVRHRTARFEGDAERLELLLGPADPAAEDEASVTQAIDLRGHARGLERMTVGDDDDRRAQLDPACLRGEPPQRRERLPERRRIACGHVGCDRDVIRGHHEVIPERFPQARPAQHRVLGRAGPEVDEVDPDFHGDVQHRSWIAILYPHGMSLPFSVWAPLAGFADEVLVVVRLIMGVTMIYYGWPKVRDPKKNAGARCGSSRRPTNGSVTGRTT